MKRGMSHQQVKISNMQYFSSLEDYCLFIYANAAKLIIGQN